MACKGFLECILKLLNFLLTIMGLAMVGYGIYLFVEYKKETSDDTSISPTSGDGDLIQLGRPMLVAISLSASIFDDLPRAWFIYLFIGVGGVLFVISCFGCIGGLTRNGCCLSCYSFLVILLILVELGCAAFIYFDKSWEDDLQTDSTGDFTMIYEFLKENWMIVKWVALGIIVFEVSQALLFVLALTVRAANKPPEYDSDEEFISSRRVRQPLLASTASGAVTAVPDQRQPTRNDAWSARMREKYGLDTSEFSYNPSEANRNHQALQPVEEKSCCTIM